MFILALRFGRLHSKFQFGLKVLKSNAGRNRLRRKGFCSSILSMPIRPLVASLIAFTFVSLHSLRAASQSGSSPVAAEPIHILFIGDSLTAGYGVRKEEAFPALVEKKLKAAGRNVKVTNGGISGSVTAEADRRLRWYLKAKPKILFLSLGANDALKGTPTPVIKANLAKALELAEQNGIKVVLGGVRIFTNFGAKYAKDFESVYSSLAREHKVTLVPFILEGVALDKALNLSDGKHPNAKGHERVAETILRAMEPLL